MSLVSESMWLTLLDLMRAKISETEYLEIRSMDVREIRQEVHDLMSVGVAQQNADAIEYALHEGHLFGFEPSTQLLLETLLREQWHTRHEDAVEALASMGSSPGVLYETACSGFGETSDLKISLARKCVWALAKLPDEMTRPYLKRLCNDGRTEVADLARQVLAKSASSH